MLWLDTGLWEQVVVESNEWLGVGLQDQIMSVLTSLGDQINAALNHSFEPAEWWNTSTVFLRRCRKVSIWGWGCRGIVVYAYQLTYNFANHLPPHKHCFMHPNLVVRQGELTGKVWDTGYPEVPYPWGLKKVFWSKFFSHHITQCFLSYQQDLFPIFPF